MADVKKRVPGKKEMRSRPLLEGLHHALRHIFFFRIETHKLSGIVFVGYINTVIIGIISSDELSITCKGTVRIVESLHNRADVFFISKKLVSTGGLFHIAAAILVFIRRGLHQAVHFHTGNVVCI